MFDVDVELAYRPHHGQRLVQKPARLAIRDQHFPPVEDGANGADPFDADIRLAIDFDLKSASALAPMTGDRRSMASRALRDRPVEFDGTPIRFADQRHEGYAPGSRREIAAVHDEPRLHERMALERADHRPMEEVVLRGIATQKCRTDLADPGAPAASAARVAGSSGQTSAQPTRPSSVVAATTVLSKLSTERPSART